MLKWTRRILVFLLLGAIVNVAVAWGCALAHGEVPTRTYFENYGPTNAGLIQIVREFGYEYVFVRDNVAQPSAHAGRKSFNGRQWWPDAGSPNPTVDGHVGCGWPMLSVSATISPAPSWRLAPRPGESLSAPTRRTVRGGYIWNKAALNETARFKIPLILPYRPLLPGSVVNSTIYALAIALTTYGSRAMCSLARWRRGLCPACAYPRGSSPVCTECGEALPAARLARRD